MRAITLLTVTLALAAGAAFADFGDIVRSWGVPRGGVCWGVAWDGEYIWCNVSYSVGPDMMYRCRPSGGGVVSSFETGCGNFIQGRGICHRLWSSRPALEMAVRDTISDESFLYRYYFNGSVVNRMRVRLPGNARFESVYFDGSNDWVCDPDDNGSKIYKIDGQGAPISSFTLNKAGRTYGITKQGDFFWFTVGGPTGAYKTRANGSVVASFGLLGEPRDCTSEDNHLWVSIGSTVFCYDVSNAPAVVPASVGRVKALFR
jgi:hypothetical protein